MEKFHGTSLSRFHPGCLSVNDTEGRLYGGNGAGRAGLQPLRGGLHLLWLRTLTPYVSLSESFHRLLFSSALFLISKIL